MKKVVLVLVSLLLLIPAVGILGTGCSSSEETTTWTLTTYTRDGEPLTAQLQDFIDTVYDRTDGKLEIVMHTGGTLFTAEQTFEAVSRGNVDLGLATASYYIGEMPASGAAFTYATFLNATLDQGLEIRKAFETDVDEIVAESDANNVTHLFWSGGGEIAQFFKESVTSMSQIAGKKLATAGGANQGIAQLQGATAVPLDPTEFYTAAQNGTVEGTSPLPISLYNALRLYEQLPYAVLFEQYIMQSLLVNNDSFNALDEDVQQALLEVAAENEAQGLVDFMENVTSDRLTMEDSGITIYEVPVADRDEWYNVFLTVGEGILAEMASETTVTQVHDIVNGVLGS